MKCLFYTLPWQNFSTDTIFFFSLKFYGIFCVSSVCPYDNKKSHRADWRFTTLEAPGKGQSINNGGNMVGCLYTWDTQYPHVYAVNERSSYQGNGYGEAKVMSTCVSSSLSFSREIRDQDCYYNLTLPSRSWCASERKAFNSIFLSSKENLE